MEPEARAQAWQEAVALFEAGRYWDAHEVLEGPWGASEGDERAFAAGVILLCAALHKSLVMGSARGGRRNYAKALRHLALLPDRYGGVDLRELEARVHDALRRATPPLAWPWASADGRPGRGQAVSEE